MQAERSTSSPDADLDRAPDMAHPEAPSARFVLVCPEKSVKETGDQRLERAFQSLALKQHLDAMREALPQSEAAYLPGAGVAFTSGCVQGLLDDRWLSVFVGCASLLPLLAFPHTAPPPHNAQAAAASAISTCTPDAVESKASALTPLLLRSEP